MIIEHKNVWLSFGLPLWQEFDTAAGPWGSTQCDCASVKLSQISLLMTGEWWTCTCVSATKISLWNRDQNRILCVFCFTRCVRSSSQNAAQTHTHAQRLYFKFTENIQSIGLRWICICAHTHTRTHRTAFEHIFPLNTILFFHFSFFVLVPFLVFISLCIFTFFLWCVCMFCFTCAKHTQTAFVLSFLSISLILSLRSFSRFVFIVKCFFYYYYYYSLAAHSTYGICVLKYLCVRACLRVNVYRTMMFWGAMIF